MNEYSFGSQYVRAYFWAVMVATGVGKDIIPATDVQFIFTTSAIIVGVLMYALIVGSVGTALSSIDTPSRNGEGEWTQCASICGRGT